MRAPWSRHTAGLWIAADGSKVRHLWAGWLTNYGGKRSECSRSIRGRVVNGAEYDALAPCAQCVAYLRQRAAYFTEALEQQDGAA